MKKSAIVQIILIIALGIIVYSNCLDGKFVWDDFGLVKDNSLIRSWRNIPEIFTEGMGGDNSNFYRPLQIISYAADYSLWGLNSVGYHLTNTLLHILAALAVYWLINILFSSQALAFLTAALFVVNPLHTESVSYISTRSDPLSLLFISLTLIFYIKSLPGARPVASALSLASCLLALLSKENSIIIPLLILLYHYTFKIKLKPRLFFSISLIVLAYVILRLTLLKSFVSISPVLFRRVPGFFAALSEYMRLLLLPVNLHLEYGNRLFAIFHPRAILGLAIFVFLIAAAVRRRNRDQLLFFAIAWFFLALLPVTNIYAINYSFMMEHWLYLPSVGFFLVLSKGLCTLFESKKTRYAGLVLAAFILSSYAYLTIRQNDYWRDPVALYKRVLQFTPSSWRFLNELGLEYSARGLNQEAIVSYKKALEINPYLAGVHYNLGALYYSLGDDRQAVLSLEKAVTLAPKYVEAYLVLGKVYCRSNRKKEASLLYKKLVSLKPGLASAHPDSPCDYFR